MSAELNVRAPFDYADADVVFRSSDGVHFRLHKTILKTASPVFEEMFTLPDDPTSSGDPQVVEMVEDAATLDAVFRLSYPVARPLLSSVDELVNTLRAVEKFQMEQLLPDLERRICSPS